MWESYSNLYNIKKLDKRISTQILKYQWHSWIARESPHNWIHLAKKQMHEIRHFRICVTLLDNESYLSWNILTMLQYIEALSLKSRWHLNSWKYPIWQQANAITTQCCPRFQQMLSRYRLWVNWIKHYWGRTWN